jgi:diguanylate cyclase (GGDEF)-like protein
MTDRTTSANLLARLTALSDQFADALDARVAQVRRLWGPVTVAGVEENIRPALAQMHEVVHTLAGSGKSFGFPDVSRTAAPLDGLFRLVLEHGQALTPEEIAQIELLVQGLEHSIHGPRLPMSLDRPMVPGPGSGGETHTFCALVVGAPDDLQTAPLCDAIHKFGYASRVVASSADYLSAAQNPLPDVIYADITTSEDVVMSLRRHPGLQQIPLIVGSTHTSFDERLRAVRLGAAAFVALPGDPQDIVKLIGSVDEAQTRRTYRVVIAEDERVLAQFYQMTLEHAGMDVRVVHEPSKLLDALSGFEPDIIVMDVYMSGCTGLELAQIVRQFPAYTTVPILFLSTESRLDLQLKARYYGGDDFLVKPLQPAQLVSAVTSRANRYWDLKKLTDRDSLTGLLNHTNILKDLEREINVAVRNGTPVAFAMVDIDHFKKVNDTYGHVVGDQVILRVTQLLRNRLRRVDYVGRYGGEEFAVVMPNTDASTAQAVMNGLREAAGQMDNPADQGNFRVTFSCGVATYPQFRTPLALTQGADDALYKAKRGGRNQVVVAEGG